MTIVADTSALLAIVFREPDRGLHALALEQSLVLLSSATLTEALIVTESRKGPEGVQVLRALVDLGVDEIVPFDANHAQAAHAAFRRFGKGRHPAGLNLGDCFSYATASLANAPLLFKGDDFAQTDLTSAL
jgi:ribonuclease VapC